MATAIAIGHSLLGHFEERTSKWRKLAKLFGSLCIAVLISAQFGRVWFFAIFTLCSIGVLYIHAWWLPSHGINGWTGEPKEKYYRLRGWSHPETNLSDRQGIELETEIGGRVLPASASNDVTSPSIPDVSDRSQ